MTDLRHGETAHQLCCRGIWQIFLVMVFAAELLNASREKTKLHAQLNNEANIVECERFKRRHKLGNILVASH